MWGLAIFFCYHLVTFYFPNRHIFLPLHFFLPFFLPSHPPRIYPRSKPPAALPKQEEEESIRPRPSPPTVQKRRKPPRPCRLPTRLPKAPRVLSTAHRPFLSPLSGVPYLALLWAAELGVYASPYQDDHHQTLPPTPPSYTNNSTQIQVLFMYQHDNISESTHSPPIRLQTFRIARKSCSISQSPHG